MKQFLDWTEAQLGRLWGRAEDAAENDDSSLAIVRILYGLFIILFATPNFSWMGDAPQRFFRPPLLSLTIFFDDFLSSTWGFALDITLIVTTICILLGIKARAAGILFSMAYIVGSSFQFSFGKIDHSILFPVFICGLSLTNWGTKYALIPDRPVSRQRQRRVLAILAVLLCFGMLTAGALKAKHWVDFDVTTGGFLSWFYRGFFGNDMQSLLAPVVLHVPPPFFEVLDYLAVIFELSPFFALLAGRKWWLLWLATASLFHLSNTLLLNIVFAIHAPIYLSFVRLHAIRWPWFQRLRWPRGRVRLFAAAVAIAIAVHYLSYFSISQVIAPVTFHALPLFESKRHLLLYTGLLIWSLTMAVIGWSAMRAFKRVA